MLRTRYWGVWGVEIGKQWCKPTTLAFWCFCFCTEVIFGGLALASSLPGWKSYMYLWNMLHTTHSATSAMVSRDHCFQFYYYTRIMNQWQKPNAGGSEDSSPSGKPKRPWATISATAVKVVSPGRVAAYWTWLKEICIYIYVYPVTRRLVLWFLKTTAFSFNALFWHFNMEEETL